MNKVLQNDFDEIISQGRINLADLENKTVLITGATGMLGSYLTKFLLYYNLKTCNHIKIIILVRNLDKVKEIFGEFLNLDYFKFILHDLNTYLNIDDSIDYIIHGASNAYGNLFYNKPVDTIDINAIATKHLLELAKNKKVKSFLFFSSSEIYGDIFTSKEYVSEFEYGTLDCLDIRNCYSLSKKLAENMCVSYFQQYNVPCKIVRIAHTFGPEFSILDTRVFSYFVRCVLNDQDIILKSDGKAKRNLLYAQDAIVAYLKVMLEGQNATSYNVCGKEEISMIDLAELIISLKPNCKSKVIYNFNDNVSNSSLSSSLKINRLVSLGYIQLNSIKQGFKKVINYHLN